MSTVSERGRVTIVVPARDEEGSIAEIVDAARSYGDEVIVVDGHSRDRTRQIAAEHGARVLVDGGKGKGDALRVGIREASGDILVFIDADGSHDPRDIPRLLQPIVENEADVVITSRRTGGSDELSVTGEQLIRHVVSQLIVLAINYRWNVGLTDSQNGFRAIRTAVARDLDLQSDLDTIEQELLMKALKRGFRVREIPSHEYERRSGTSRVVVWRFWYAYLWSFVRHIV